MPSEGPLCHLYSDTFVQLSISIFMTTDSIKPEKPPLDFHIPR